MVYCKVRNADKRTVVYRRPEQTLFSTNSAIYNHSQMLTTRNSQVSTMSSFLSDNSNDLMKTDINEIPTTRITKATTTMTTTGRNYNKDGSDNDNDNENIVNPSNPPLLDEFKDINEIEAEEDNFLLGHRDEEEPEPVPPVVPEAALVQEATNPRTRRLLRFPLPKQMPVAWISSAFSLPTESSKSHLNPRSTEVGKQAILYLIAFYLTHVFSTTNRIYQQVTHGKRIYALIVIHSWFDPFQGMLNFIVYQRPRYMIVRKKHPHISRWGALVRVLHFSFMQSKFQTRDQNNMNNGTNLGSTARDDSNHTSAHHHDSPIITSSSFVQPTPSRRGRQYAFGLSIIKEATSLGDEHYTSSQEFVSNELTQITSLNATIQQKPEEQSDQQQQSEDHTPPTTTTTSSQEAVVENETQAPQSTTTFNCVTDDEEDDNEDEDDKEDSESSPEPVRTMSTNSISIDDER